MDETVIKAAWGAIFMIASSTHCCGVVGSNFLETHTGASAECRVNG
jgi:hypothetical protein